MASEVQGIDRGRSCRHTRARGGASNQPARCAVSSCKVVRRAGHRFRFSASVAWRGVAWRIAASHGGWCAEISNLDHLRERAIYRSELNPCAEAEALPWMWLAAVQQGSCS